MNCKARLWTGITMFLILVFNYAVIGLPMIKRASFIEKKTRAVLIEQVKSGKIFKNSEDEYMMGILKREKESLDKKILILNCAAATLLIIIGSWTIFGLFTSKGRF